MKMYSRVFVVFVWTLGVFQKCTSLSLVDLPDSDLNNLVTPDRSAILRDWIAKNNRQGGFEVKKSSAEKEYYYCNIGNTVIQLRNDSGKSDTHTHSISSGYWTDRVTKRTLLSNDNIKTHTCYPTHGYVDLDVNVQDGTYQIEPLGPYCGNGDRYNAEDRSCIPCADGPDWATAPSFTRGFKLPYFDIETVPGLPSAEKEKEFRKVPTKSGTCETDGAVPTHQYSVLCRSLLQKYDFWDILKKHDAEAVIPDGFTTGLLMSCAWHVSEQMSYYTFPTSVRTLSIGNFNPGIPLTCAKHEPKPARHECQFCGMFDTVCGPSSVELKDDDPDSPSYCYAPPELGKSFVGPLGVNSIDRDVASMFYGSGDYTYKAKVWPNVFTSLEDTVDFSFAEHSSNTCNVLRSQDIRGMGYGFKDEEWALCRHMNMMNYNCEDMDLRTLTMKPLLMFKDVDLCVMEFNRNIFANITDRTSTGFTLDLMTVDNGKKETGEYVFAMPDVSEYYNGSLISVVTGADFADELGEQHSISVSGNKMFVAFGMNYDEDWSAISLVTLHPYSKTILRHHMLTGWFQREIKTVHTIATVCMTRIWEAEDPAAEKVDRVFLIASVTSDDDEKGIWAADQDGVPLEKGISDGYSHAGKHFTPLGFNWKLYAVHRLFTGAEHLLMAVVDSDTNHIYIFDGYFDASEAFCIQDDKVTSTDQCSEPETVSGIAWDSSLESPTLSIVTHVVDDLHVNIYHPRRHERETIVERCNYDMFRNAAPSSTWDGIANADLAYDFESGRCELDHNNIEQCEQGTYQNAYTAIESTFLSNTPLPSGCSYCPSGFYQDEIGMTECKPAMAGTYCKGEGLVECNECLPGRYSGGESERNQTLGTTECTLCPAGYFALENATQSCKKCPYPADSTLRGFCDFRGALFPVSKCTSGIPRGDDEWTKYPDPLFHSCCATSTHSASFDPEEDWVTSLKDTWHDETYLYCAHGHTLYSSFGDDLIAALKPSSDSNTCHLQLEEPVAHKIASCCDKQTDFSQLKSAQVGDTVYCYQSSYPDFPALTECSIHAGPRHDAILNEDVENFLNQPVTDVSRTTALRNYWSECGTKPYDGKLDAVAVYHQDDVERCEPVENAVPIARYIRPQEIHAIHPMGNTSNTTVFGFEKSDGVEVRDCANGYYHETTWKHAIPPTKSCVRQRKGSEYEWHIRIRQFDVTRDDVFHGWRQKDNFLLKDQIVDTWNVTAENRDQIRNIRNLNGIKGYTLNNTWYTFEQYHIPSFETNMKGGVWYSASAETRPYRNCRYVGTKDGPNQTMIINGTNYSVATTVPTVYFCSTTYPFTDVDTGCSGLVDCPLWEWWPRPMTDYGYVNGDPCYCNGKLEYDGVCVQSKDDDDVWLTDPESQLFNVSGPTGAPVQDCPHVSIRRMFSGVASDPNEMTWLKDAYKQSCKCGSTICNGDDAHKLIYGGNVNLTLEDTYLTVSCIQDTCAYNTMQVDKWNDGDFQTRNSHDCTNETTGLCGSMGWGRYHTGSDYSLLTGYYSANELVGVYECENKDMTAPNDFANYGMGYFLRDGLFEINRLGFPKYCACGHILCNYNEYCDVIDGQGTCGSTPLDILATRRSNLTVCPLFDRSNVSQFMQDYITIGTCNCGNCDVADVDRTKCVCTDGEYCTQHSGEVPSCKACPCDLATQYTVQTELNISCQTRATCEPGHVVSYEGDIYTDTVCSPCPDGHWQPDRLAHDSQKTCEPWTECLLGNKRDGTPTTDTECYSCSYDEKLVGNACEPACEEQHIMDNGNCTDYCNPGKYFTGMDCAECPEGQYQHLYGRTKCFPHHVTNASECLTNEYWMQPNKTFPGICVRRTECLCPTLSDEGNATSDNTCRLRDGAPYALKIYRAIVEVTNSTLSQPSLERKVRAAFFCGTISSSGANVTIDVISHALQHNRASKYFPYKSGTAMFTLDGSLRLVRAYNTSSQ